MRHAKKLAARRKLQNQWRLKRIRRLVGRLLVMKVADCLSEDSDCNHDWQRDGQTITAVRWTCSKCGGSRFG